MNVYVVCFDISDDHARRNVARRLKHYGKRVRRSVFEISTSGAQELDILCAELREFVEASDNLHFYKLCKSCRTESHDQHGERVASFPVATIM